MKQTKAQILSQLDDFTRGYIAAALWSENDNSDESGGDPIDTNYTLDDITKESLSILIADCKSFQEKAADLLKEAYQLYKTVDGHPVEEYGGHDFWLNRNSHGCGFWDRGFPENLGEELSKLAKSFGTCNLTVAGKKVHVL